MDRKIYLLDLQQTIYDVRSISFGIGDIQKKTKNDKTSQIGI